MLAVLGEYLKTLNSEIESYEQLIAHKREEAQQLAQLQGQVVEALGLLKDVVDELRLVDPEAIATLQAAVLQIFDNGNGNGQPKSYIPSPGGDVVALPLDKPSTKAENPVESTQSDNSLMTNSNEPEESPIDSKPSQEKSNFIRLSENVVYDPDNVLLCAGINAYNRAKAWGHWLCFAHTVGARFEVTHESRSPGYNYDLVVFGINPEDAQRLAQCALTQHPNALENDFWQPLKRHPQAAPPRPQVCQPGDLAVGDLARKDDGREYQVIGVSDEGSVVKVVNEDDMEMAFSVGALYLVKKAESHSDGHLATVTDAFSNGQANRQGLEIGSQVLIRSSRYQGKYDGHKGVIAAEPTHFGVKVD
ncbi:MAG: hypothetical protein ACRDEA_09600, partial [Microcystaceae cyanobacterium]